MSVEIENVSVVAGGHQALSDVSLRVDDREVVAVLGPSGSGKTTLLRVVAGLQPPSRGRVSIDGVDVTAVPTHRRAVGLMFQDHALFPHRDVAGNVAFGLRMAGHGRPEIRRRVDEVLDLVGLGGFAGRSVEHLSGGERQRVALARALAPRPSLLLLDEPLGSLDRALRDRLLDELGDVLHASGATVIHVTHDQAEAFATGDRVVVVRDGRIAQVGPAEELWRRPHDTGVARIVGPAGIVPVDVGADGVVHAPWGSLPPGLVGRAPGLGAGPASLVLRPDAVEVVDQGEAPERPTFEGRVIARMFRGDHVHLRARVDGNVSSVELPIVDRAGSSGPIGSTLVLALVSGAGIVVPPAP